MRKIYRRGLPLLLLLLSLEGRAQYFYIIHEGPRMMCGGWEIYYGIKNRVNLLEETGMPVGRYGLISDSVAIERGNDSLFLLSPLYKNLTCKIYVIDTATRKKIFSMPVFCNAAPVRFYISPLSTDPHRHQSPKIFIPSMDRVSIESRMRDCHDYASRLKVLSYRLCLVRGAEEITSMKMIRRRKISEKFKNEILDKMRSGDNIELRDIILKNKDGADILVANYLIYALW